MRKFLAMAMLLIFTFSYAGATVDDFTDDITVQVENDEITPLVIPLTDESADATHPLPSEEPGDYPQETISTTYSFQKEYLQYHSTYGMSCKQMSTITFGFDYASTNTYPCADFNLMTHTSWFRPA